MPHPQVRPRYAGSIPRETAQQLRQLETDGIVQRKVHNQVPPKVEYRLTTWGQSLCPALDALLEWAEMRDRQTPNAGT